MEDKEAECTFSTLDFGHDSRLAMVNEMVGITGPVHA